MTENTEAIAEDTSAEAPQSDEGLAIQFADEDTQTAEPEAGETAEPTQEKYFGKYNTIEDAERAYKEAERLAHERSEEAAAYRKALEVAGQTQERTPEQTLGQPDPGRFKQQLESQLQEDPVGTIMQLVQFGAQQQFTEREKVGSQRMQEFQQYASQPEFAEVAPQVLSQLSVDPSADIEKEFLKATLAHMGAKQATDNVTQQATAQRMHVEPATGSPTSASMKIVVEDEAAQLRSAFPDLRDAEKWKELNVNLAKVKQAGIHGKLNPLTNKPEGTSLDAWRQARKTKLGG